MKRSAPPNEVVSHGRSVAFLRGINVGTAKRIAMADLRALFEALGYRDVRTVLNSGNIIFTVVKPTAKGESDRIERAIAARLKVQTRVTVRSAPEVIEALGKNPLASMAANPSRLLLMWLRDADAAARVKPLLARRWSPESLALGGTTAYLWCPEGIAVSPLWSEMNRVVGDAGTARNLATMTKILALLDSTPAR